MRELFFIGLVYLQLNMSVGESLVLASCEKLRGLDFRASLIPDLQNAGFYFMGFVISNFFLGV